MNQEELEARKNALIAEVYAAFEDVTREGGVSWSQSRVEDLYGTPDEYAGAAKQDTELRWQDLVEDEVWRDDPGVGGFTFLDAIGFRYYLPAALVRDLRRGISEVLDFQLNCPPPGAKGRKFRLSKWVLLNERQQRCVATFVRFAIDRENHDESLGLSLENYQHAWENYWSDFAAEQC